MLDIKSFWPEHERLPLSELERVACKVEEISLLLSVLLDNLEASAGNAAASAVLSVSIRELSAVLRSLQDILAGVNAPGNQAPVN